MVMVVVCAGGVWGEVVFGSDGGDVCGGCVTVCSGGGCV